MHLFCELRDDPRVDLISLGKLIAGSCEVANLSWIDDCNCIVVLLQGVDERSFPTTGGFETDEMRLYFLADGEQHFDAVMSVWDRFSFLLI